MPTPARSTPMETALLNKLTHLPVTTRRKLYLRRFDFSDSPVLCWFHNVTRQGRRYTMSCDVADDGSLEVSFKPARSRKPHPTPKAEHFPGQAGR